MNNNAKWPLIMSFLSFISGVLLILLSIFAYQFISDFICVIIGIIIAVLNFYSMIIYAQNFWFSKVNVVEFIISFCAEILSLMFIFWHNSVMCIIFGSFLFIMPTIRIIITRDHFERFKVEMPCYFMMLLILFNLLDIMLKVLLIITGGVLAALSVGLIVLAIISTNKGKSVIKNKHKSDSINVEVSETDEDSDFFEI
ncbi:MAG: hypothetical protein IKP77_03775 [Acholeplasmatales bacterium]|nr:hypothetical protein [Acholeplasmatales bacterium]